MKRSHGFSLIELLVVIAIIAFFSMLVVPNFFKILARAKRTEAYVQLRSLYMAEKTYFMEHGRYSDRLTGPQALDWKAEGNVYYTYGFPGSAVTGTLKAPASALTGAKATETEFVIAAAADIDGDGKLDLITINQDGKVTIVQDDLA